MHAISVCPVCNQPGSFDGLCPNCGQKTGNPRRDPLSAKLVAAIQSRVEREWHQASRIHPQLSLPLQQFTEKVLQIAERHSSAIGTQSVSREQTVFQLLDNLKWVDLFLATACAAGDGPAWESFRRQYQPVIQAAAIKTSKSSSEASELSVTLLTDLFLPNSGSGESKIGHYHGLGSLEGWIKVV